MSNSTVAVVIPDVINSCHRDNILGWLLSFSSLLPFVLPSALTYAPLMFSNIPLKRYNLTLYFTYFVIGSGLVFTSCWIINDTINDPRPDWQPCDRSPATASPFFCVAIWFIYSSAIIRMIDAERTTLVIMDHPEKFKPKGWLHEKVDFYSIVIYFIIIILYVAHIWYNGYMSAVQVLNSLAISLGYAAIWITAYGLSAHILLNWISSMPLMNKWFYDSEMPAVYMAKK
jgi:hypothetical protein